MQLKKTAIAVLIMLFCIIPAFAAVREDFVFTDGLIDAQNDLYIDSVAAWEDCAFLHDYNNGCIWKVDLNTCETEAISEIVDQEGTTYSISALASYSDRLYALASSYQRDASMITYMGSALYELKPSDSSFDKNRICTLDLSDYVTHVSGWGDELSACTMIYREEAVYCLFHYSPALVKISLIDKSMRAIDVEEPIYMAEYGSNQLLLSCQNSDGTQRLVTYDIQKDIIQDLVDGVDSSVSGIVYRESDSLLYAVSEGTVYCIDSQAEAIRPERCGEVEHYAEMSGGADLRDYLLWWSPSEAIFAKMDAAALESQDLTYTVLGSFSGDSAEDFARHYGGLHMHNISRTEKEIINDILIHDDAIDVYILDTAESSIYRSLYQRDYLRPLNNKSILEMVGNMYPLIRDLAMREGEVVAVPVSMTLPINPLGINRDLCAELGMDIPDSWPVLLNLLEQGCPQKDTYLFSWNDAQELESELFSLLMSAYSAAMNSGKGPSQYNTPELVELLQRLRTLDYEQLIQTAAPEEEMNARILFALETPDNCRVRITDYDPMPLSIRPGEPAYVYANITLMCVNPYSQKQELAVEFLEYTLENLNPARAAQLFETSIAPIEGVDYAALKRAYDDGVFEREAAIKAAAAVDQPALREELSRYSENNKQMLEEMRYIVTEESLNAFRARLDTYVPYYDEGLSEEASDQLGEANMRYFAGSLSIEQYLQELDREITARALEDRADR